METRVDPLQAGGQSYRRGVRCKLAAAGARSMVSFNTEMHSSSASFARRTGKSLVPRSLDECDAAISERSEHEQDCWT